jgi:S-adenosylmethionine hydrolase
MARGHETISFLSDYGLVDEFVGVVKSVIRTMAPAVQVIDITHDVAPHDLRGGALALVRAVQYLAPGVVLAVVDPGVGTERRGIAVEVGEQGEGVFVGPDNGLLASAVSMCGGARRAVSLTNTEFHLPGPSSTFDGRDVFAPVAAHLCNGVDLAELGDLIDPIGLRPGVLPLSRDEEGTIIGEVLWVDRFGNIQLNVDPDEIESWGDRISVRWADQVRTASRARTYADLKAGEVGLVTDSYGLLSLAFDRLSASDQLRLRAGDAVTLAPAT